VGSIVGALALTPGGLVAGHREQLAAWRLGQEPVLGEWLNSMDQLASVCRLCDSTSPALQYGLCLP
jgi:hypothetical protein